MSIAWDRNRDLLRAHGRCMGALIFAVFGGCWLLLSCVYFHHFRVATVGPICIAALLLAAAAWRIDRSNPAPVLDEILSGRKKADDRTFGIINGITYSIVFLLFLVLPRVGLQNYIFPGFVALIGLHFFPMPTLYRHTANTVTGIFMVVWAIFCAIAFKADGNRMAAFVALGAGIALWSSWAFALQTSSRLFRVLAPDHDQQRDTNNQHPPTVQVKSRLGIALAQQSTDEESECPYPGDRSDRHSQLLGLGLRKSAKNINR